MPKHPQYSVPAVVRGRMSGLWLIATRSRAAFAGPTRFGFILLTRVCLSQVRAHAHSSPADVVQRLTEQMAEYEPSAHLLMRRGSQNRARGYLKKAEYDLCHVLVLELKHRGARAELYLKTNRSEDALDLINRAIADAPTAIAHLYAIRADAYAELRRNAAALADYDFAIVKHETEIDWYLKRSVVQQRLKRHGDRVRGLRDGHQITGIAVLHIECIDALIDAGRLREVIHHIEPRLRAARLKSSWFIRRARARLHLGQTVQAQHDLHLAITEVTDRIHPSRPNPDLLIDRAIAYLLLGNESAAPQDKEHAQRQRVHTSRLHRFETFQLNKRRSSTSWRTCRCRPPS